MDDGFWRGRRVLLTGHSGFKGAWAYAWLRELGAVVTGYALAPAPGPNLWNLIGADAALGAKQGARSVVGDVRDLHAMQAAVEESQPQVVIHMAAQALVRESYRDPLGTYATNVMGTATLLQACRAARGLQCVVIVTSDKVYENLRSGRPFAEQDRLGGHDPYSNSKACAELVTQSFRESFFPHGPPLASARAGNVIGGGDWADDRLIPDCVRGLADGTPVLLRYPDAVRPWQHVLEPVSGYLALAQALVLAPERAPRALNFGPDPSAFCTVREVVEAFGARFEGRPGWRQDVIPPLPEAATLTLSSDLAVRTLGWRPRLNLEDALSWTADWYRSHADGQDMAAVTRAQIARYAGSPREVGGMKCVILAGGKGTRIAEESNTRPKPMVEIGARPILWHIMKSYAAHGVTEFIVCLGYKGYMVKEYFANYFLHQADVTFNMAGNRVDYHDCRSEPWKVTLVDTGEESMTGGRLLQVGKYLAPGETFCMTYGDGVADIDIAAEIAFHHEQGCRATVACVRPPARFGRIVIEGTRAVSFEEKPRGEGGLINGGFFVLEPSVLELIDGIDTVWENEPMERLAQSGQLAAWVHQGFWQPMDTLRDKQHLNALWESGAAPWKRWQG